MITVKFMAEKPGPSNENEIGLVTASNPGEPVSLLYLDGRTSRTHEDDLISVQVSERTIRKFSDMLLNLGAQIGLLQGGYCHSSIKIKELITEYLLDEGLDRKSDNITKVIEQFLLGLQKSNPELFKSVPDDRFVLRQHRSDSVVPQTNRNPNQFTEEF